MSKQYKSLHPTKYYRDFLEQKIRPDGRKFEDYRPIIVNCGSIETADGSAFAKIGQTMVVCGIKAELCQPKPDSPNEGFIIPNMELPPLCSSKFRPGPPTEQAQVLSELIAEIIKNSECLNMKSLCIHTDKLAWCLYADIICLDYDGALIDAAIVALITALKTLTLPEVDYDPATDNKQVNLEERKHLTIRNIPCSTTFITFDETILIDPSVEEEDLCTGQFTIVTKDSELCLVHKPGGTPLDDEQLSRCIRESTKRAKIIEKLIAVAAEKK